MKTQKTQFLISLLIQDVKSQMRNGLYLAAGTVLLVYLSLLWILPDNMKRSAAVFFIMTDTAAMGAFFAGAVVLSEKTSGILRALWITPAGIQTYALSKILSLSALSAFSGLILFFSAGFFSDSFNSVMNESLFPKRSTVFEIISVMYSVILLSLLFTALGIRISLGSVSLNQYFFRTVILVVPLFIPAICFLIPGCSKFLMLLSPISASVLLLLADYHLLMDSHQPSYINLYDSSLTVILISYLIMILYMAAIYRNLIHKLNRLNPDFGIKS